MVARNRSAPATRPVAPPSATPSIRGKISVIRPSRAAAASSVDSHLLVVLLLGVDAPEVVPLAVGEVADGEEAGEHRVVLVVVAVQPVPADGLEVLEPVHELAGQCRGAPGRWRRRPDTPWARGTRSRRRSPTRAPARCARAPPCRAGSARRPAWSTARRPREQKYSRPRLAFARVGHHLGAPAPEVLDAPDLDLGRVDVDPVVGKGIGTVHDETHGEEVAVATAGAPPRAPAREAAESRRSTSWVTGMLEMKSGRPPPPPRRPRRRRPRCPRARRCGGCATTSRCRRTAPPCRRISSVTARHIMPGPSRG